MQLGRNGIDVNEDIICLVLMEPGSSQYLGRKTETRVSLQWLTQHKQVGGHSVESSV